jgi:subtilase family serine protease
VNACGGNGWFGEETLDVEAVHAMAPAANVVYYAARSCTDTDFLEALGRVVDENTASIVTNSWGDLDLGTTSGTIAAYEQIFKQGALQGIGFMFSSGDDGDEQLSSGQIQTDYPASDPWVTAVGGTSTAIGSSGNLLWQTGWGTNKYTLSADGASWVPASIPPFLYGSGGGFSTLFDRPAYQSGVVNEPTPGRAVPDVSLDGDPTTGMLVGETQAFPDGVRYGEYRIGGTSLSSPLFAGVQALAA